MSKSWRYRTVPALFPHISLFWFLSLNIKEDSDLGQILGPEAGDLALFPALGNVSYARSSYLSVGDQITEYGNLSCSDIGCISNVTTPYLFAYSNSLGSDRKHNVRESELRSCNMIYQE
jgi:hypothetical protein